MNDAILMKLLVYTVVVIPEDVHEEIIVARPISRCILQERYLLVHDQGGVSFDSVLFLNLCISDKCKRNDLVFVSVTALSNN